MASRPFGEGSVLDDDIVETDDEFEPAASPTPAAEGGEEDSSPRSPSSPRSIRESLEDAYREEEIKAERARDEQGRFVKADDAAKSAPAAKEPPATTGAKPEQTVNEPASAPVAVQGGPPPGWSQEAKAAYQSLPPAVQQAVLKREKEVSDGFATYSANAKEFEAVVGPRRQYYAEQGISDHEAINNLWLWFEALQNSPGNAFPELAKLFRYDLSTVPPTGQSESQPSPQIDQRYASMEAAIRQQQQLLNGFVTAAEQERQSRIEAEFTEFARTHPHFEELRVHMGQLMKAGMAGDLADAYQKAAAIHPDIGQKLRQEEAAKAAAEAAAKAAQPRQAPRLAAVSPRTASPRGADSRPPGTGRSIRDELRAAMDTGV